MNLLDLFATVKAKDEASDKIKSIADGIKTTMGGALKVGAAAGAAAITAAAGGVAAIGKASVDAYADFEQLQGGIEKLYGDSADQMMSYARNAFQTAGMSANEYMETATSFSAALINSLGGDTAKAAEMADVAMRAMSDNVNTFGTDAEAVKNAFMGLSRENYTMLDNLKLGYAGTAQGMLDLINDSGVLGETLTDTSQLGEVGFAKMVEAIQAVQEQQNIAGTTAKEAASTISGSITAAKAAWQNFLAALADPNADIETVTQQLADTIGTVASNVLETAKRIAPTLAEAIPQFIADMIPVLVEVIDQIVTNLVPMLPTLVNAVVQGLIELLPVLLNGALQLFMALVQALPMILPALVEAVVQAIYMIVDMLPTLIPVLLDAAVKLFFALVEALPQIIGALLQAAGAVLQGLFSFITGKKGTMSENAKGFMGGFLDGVKAKFEGIKEWFRNLPQNIVSAIGNVGRVLWDAGKSIINGLWEGLKSAWESVTGWFGSITSKIPKLKGPEDVDRRLLVRNGIATMSGYLEGLQTGEAAVVDNLRGFTRELPSVAVSGGLGGIQGAGGGVVVTGNTFNVREDKDIEKVANELYTLISRKGAGRSYAWA